MGKGDRSWTRWRKDNQRKKKARAKQQTAARGRKTSSS